MLICFKSVLPTRKKQDFLQIFPYSARQWLVSYAKICIHWYFSMSLWLLKLAFFEWPQKVHSQRFFVIYCDAERSAKEGQIKDSHIQNKNNTNAKVLKALLSRCSIIHIKDPCSWHNPFTKVLLPALVTDTSHVMYVPPLSELTDAMWCMFFRYQPHSTEECCTSQTTYLTSRFILC